MISTTNRDLLLADATTSKLTTVTTRTGYVRIDKENVSIFWSTADANDFFVGTRTDGDLVSCASISEARNLLSL